MRNLTTSEVHPARPLRVAVVGGGASAVITAAHLLGAADADHPVDVRIIEKDPTIGPGLAYRTTHPAHTVNNFAGRLSAIDGDPDHLLRWSARRGRPLEPTDFPRRSHYGRYLRDLLDDLEVPEGSALRRTRGLVTDVVRQPGHGGATPVEVRLSCGWSVLADHVVLALGNPPPRRQPAYEGLTERYVGDPWSDQDTRGLTERVGGGHDVLLLGTSHTMVDVIAALHQSSPMTRFTAVSRTGLLPSAHRGGNTRLHDLFHPGQASLDVLQERVAARINELTEVGGDWRDVVDSVRAAANDLWAGLTPDEQERFAREGARPWEIARHRLAPEMAVFVAGLQASGRLRVTTVDQVDPRAFDSIVNCTGPAPVPTRGWNRLVDSLLDAGTIRAHRLGLGLDLDPRARVIGADGSVDEQISVVGPARKGLEWEVTAVPDLRVQAARLSRDLLGLDAVATPETTRAHQLA